MDTTIHQFSDRTFPVTTDSGIENCSGASGNSSALLTSGSNAACSNSEATSAIIDLSEVQDDITQDDDDESRADLNGLMTTSDQQNNRRISKHTSSDSGSTFELIDYRSPDDDGLGGPGIETRRVPPQDLNIGKRHGSESSTKTCEMDLQEERDTFSPVSTGYSSGEPQPHNRHLEERYSSLEYTPEEIGPPSNISMSADIDNKIFDKRKVKSHSSKEEKQRQNEEIVIMETSSISSETGSWESVFPHRPNPDIKDCCRNFLQNERMNSIDGASCKPVERMEKCDPPSMQQASSSSVAACFIDASTLLDESEVAYPSFGPQSSTTMDARPIAKASTSEKSPDFSEDSEKDGWPKKRHYDKLETFHKSFEMCRTKPITKINSTSSSSSRESPQRANSSEENSNNLSDEEKLWKRESSKQNPARFDVKDQYVTNGSEMYQEMFSTSGEGKDSLTRQDTVDMKEGETVRLRKDQERKQGNLVFQNSIQQFSGHLISPKVPFVEDVSFTEYPQPSSSIVSSDNDGYPQNLDSSGNFGDASDCAESSSNFNSSNVQQDADRPMSCVLPGTPHNSIVQISMSDQRDGGRESACESDSSIGIKIPKRSLRCDDSAPIVSGGASIKDFTPKQCESPPVQRKTETCPIVSGGFASLDLNLEDELKRKERHKKPDAVTSWVVDMGNCKNQRRRSTSSSSSTENTARSVDASLEPPGSAGSQRSGLGFYVSLNDMEAPKSIDDQRNVSRSLHEHVKKSTGFYVDLSESENSRNATPPPSAQTNTPPVNGNDKKNLFSMFIDFGDKKIVSKREPLSLASRLSSSLHYKKDGDAKQNSSSTETLMSRSITNHYSTEKLDSEGEPVKSSSDESKPPSSLNAEFEIPLMRRMIPKSFQKDESKRHSWNNSEPVSGSYDQREHKRSASLTADKGGIMNILDKIPLISKTSSMSIDSSLSPFEDFTEISTYSNKSNSTTSISVHSSVGDNDNQNKKLKKRRRDVHLNETFDKSSQGSLTDGVLSKDLSPASTTDTEDITFQQDEISAMASDATANKENGRPPTVMETIIETKETASPKKEPTDQKPKIDKSSTHTMETLHATIEKQKQLLETVTEHVEANSSFVKLSDMDKPMTKFELHSPEVIMSKSVGSHRLSRLFQDSSRNRPHSWTMTRSTGNNIVNITSSVENLKSLTRLFPHLSKELSNSLPGDVTFEQCFKSPNDNEYLHSDLSGESSLASSISRSGMDESSISCRQPRRLGEDLLKMFLQEIGTDVIVEVNGRRIKAHKCILRSRCQYFAAMLAGGWVQSAGNVISLPGYSYSAVHFALCHIYSGASHPPEGISLMELAALADLLGLEGLKEVTGHALKMNYCHNFHKPCSGCIDGILQVLPVALNHALDDLYRKCLKWTCKHYLKVWPTRSFAHLPADIFGRCRQQIVAHLTSETVLESILDCDHLISQLAPCRWATAIENLVRDILDSAYGYIGDHFATLIASDSFLSLGHDKNLYISRLESILLRTASSLTPDQACRSYQRITRLNAVLAAKVIKVPHMDSHGNSYNNEVHEEEMDWNEEFIRLVSAILSAVEQCLTRQCARAMRVSAWQRMDLELRKKIQKLACLTEPLDLKRGKPVTKALSFNTSSRNQDLYQVKLAIQAHSKRALAQDTQLYRATAHTQTHNHEKDVQTNEKGVQANNHDTKDALGKIHKSTSKAHVPVIITHHQTKQKISEKPKILGHRRTQSEDTSSSTKPPTQIINKNVAASSTRLSEIRPRYLEPRKPRVPLKSQTSSNIPGHRGKQISSSDSSRTSSPAIGKRPMANPNRKVGLKSINMSLDSLASPSKKSEKLKGVIDMEISIDSLADSMKSSLKTDKTISQESLGRCDITKKEITVVKNNKISRSNPMINKENNHQQASSKILTNKFVKNKSLSCQTTSNSSPSSITNKSSRLSSTTSSVNSPRDAYKNRSISVPAAGQNGNGPRRSFLSAKSREILARKSSSSSQSVSSVKSQGPFIAAPLKPQLQANPVNKSASSSCIPTRKTFPPTTLHLRRTAKFVKNDISSPTISSQLKATQKVSSRANNNNKAERSSRKGINDLEKIELVIESNSPKEIRIESKLERSSTFCKEASDLPVSELQVIE